MECIPSQEQITDSCTELVIFFYSRSCHEPFQIKSPKWIANPEPHPVPPSRQAYSYTLQQYPALYSCSMCPTLYCAWRQCSWLILIRSCHPQSAFYGRQAERDKPQIIWKHGKALCRGCCMAWSCSRFIFDLMPYCWVLFEPCPICGWINKKWVRVKMRVGKNRIILIS